MKRIDEEKLGIFIDNFMQHVDQIKKQQVYAFGFAVSGLPMLHFYCEIGGIKRLKTANVKFLMSCNVHHCTIKKQSYKEIRAAIKQAYREFMLNNYKTEFIYEH